MRKLLLFGLFQCLLLNAFPQGFPAEIVIMQIDRDFYVAGEPVLYQFSTLNASTHRLSDNSKMGYVLLRNAQSKVVIKQRIVLEKGSTAGSFVLPDTLSSGIYQMVGFTNFMRNFGEKSYFQKEVIIVNQSDTEYNFLKKQPPLAHSQSVAWQEKLKITIDSDIYLPDRKVQVKIEPVSGNAKVSVSVFENSNHPVSPVVPKIDIPVETTQQQMKFQPETKGNILMGEVVDETTQQPIAGAIVMLSCVDTVANLQYAVTDSKGVFRFLLSNYYDGKELYLSLKNGIKEDGWKIRVEDKFAMSSKFRAVFSATPDSNFIAKSQNIAYINKSYDVEVYQHHKSKENVMCPAPRFYYDGAKTLYPADYSSLDDFSEIVTELFPFLSIKKHANNSQIKVGGATSEQFEYNGPALFLDGIYMDNINNILKLGSDKIKKIDVIYAERVLGDLVFQGVISIVTKGNMKQTMPTSVNTLKIMNTDVANADYLQIAAGLPDQNRKIPYVRQLLYWNPSVEIFNSKDTEFEFITSQNEGNYTILVQGISDNGLPVCVSKKFKVKK